MKNNKRKFSRTISAAMAAVTVAASLTGVSSFALTPGDINGDGKVDVKDLVRLMRVLAGDKNIESDPVMNDTNGDTKVDTKDLIRLMKYLSGQDVEIFPQEKSVLYYVSADATDGDGTASKPFGTIAEAQSAIEQACKNGSIPEDYNIDLIFLGGDYYQRSALVISSEKLGGRTLRYRAAAGKTVRIVGGEYLDNSKMGGADELAKASIKDAKAREAVITYDLSAGGYDYTNDAFAIYEDGVRGVEARYPNKFAECGLFVGFSGIDGSGEMHTFDDKDGIVSSWKNAEGVKVEGGFRADWSIDRGVIQKVENGKVYMTATNTPGENGTYYFYDVLDEIDAPGEYYIDDSTGMLYLYPTSDASSTELLVPVCADTLIQIQGDGITLDGITVEGGLGTGIKIDGDNCSVRNCTVRCFREYGIDGKGNNITVYNNEVSQLGKGGIDLGGGDDATMKHSGNLIDNNSVHDYALVDTVYNAGIGASGFGCTVTHNEIYNAPHNAINYTANYMVMEYNYIHDVCRFANDAGAVYDGGWGATTLFRNNIIENTVNIYRTQDPWRPDDPEARVALGSPNGYYCDDGGANKTVDSNIFVNIGGNALAIGGGRDNTLTNNIIVDGGVGYDDRVYYKIKGQANAGWTTGQTDFPGGPLWRGLLSNLAYGTEEWAMSFPLTTVIGASNVVDYNSRYIGKSFGSANLRQNVIYPSTAPFLLQPNASRLVDTKDNYAAQTMNEIGFVDFDGGDYRIKSNSPIYMALPGLVPCDAANVGRR